MRSNKASEAGYSARVNAAQACLRRFMPHRSLMVERPDHLYAVSHYAHALADSLAYAAAMSIDLLRRSPRRGLAA